MALMAGLLEVDIEEVLDFLNKHELRATYGAVADVLGADPNAILLGDRRPRASWVVNKRTGSPTGYERHELHPRLRNRPEIIKSGLALGRLLAREREMRKTEQLWMEREIEQMRECGHVMLRPQ